MKTKILLILVVFVTLFIGCKEDEEIDIKLLDGKWLVQYDEGVVAEGYVHYLFQAKEYVHGLFTGKMYIYDAFAGNKEISFNWLYGHSTINTKTLYIEYQQEGDKWKIEDYYVEKLTKNRCKLVSVLKDDNGKPVKTLNLKRIN